MRQLGQVELRNLYRVYADGDSYIVTGENPRGQRYECRVRREALSYLRDRIRGQRVTYARGTKRRPFRYQGTSRVS